MQPPESVTQLLIEGSFIDSPAYKAGAEILAEDHELKAGQTVSHYRILERLGA